MSKGSNQSSRVIAIGLMLFALFFGAGNLIFPSSMGQNAGYNVWWSVLGFIISGVGLPLVYLPWDIRAVKTCASWQAA